ncbi:MAG TPA: hypothetical protein VGD29_11090 [Actinoplanes sp.]
MRMLLGSRSSRARRGDHSGSGRHCAGHPLTVVTFADLRDARPENLAGTAEAWQQFSTKQTRLQNAVVTDLAGRWATPVGREEAADAALIRMTSLHDEFELYAMRTRNLATMPIQACGTFRRHQLNLQAAVDAVTTLGLSANWHRTPRAPTI